MMKIFSHMHSRKKWGSLLILIAQLLVVLISNRAAADWRGVKPLTQAEFDLHIQQLNLTGLLILGAKQLSISYQLEREAVDKALKKVTAWSVNHQPLTDNADNWDLIHESNSTSNSAYEQWDAIIRDLEDRYFAGLKAIVPEKEELLASLIRARVRLSMLDEEHVSRRWCYGAHLDLISELKGIATDNEIVSEVLLEYEHSMQSELEQFAKAIIIAEKDGIPSGDLMRLAVEQFGVEGAQTEINTVVMKNAQIGLALSRLRLLNERTIQKLLSILPTEDSERFRKKVYSELYPFLFKDSKPIDLYRQVKKLRDLTEEQRVAIERLHDEFQTRRDRELTSLAATYRQSVGKDSVLDRYQNMIMFRITRDPDLPKKSAQKLEFESALEEWNAIETQYTTRINNILTTKQKKQLK